MFISVEKKLLALPDLRQGLDHIQGFSIGALAIYHQQADDIACTTDREHHPGGYRILPRQPDDLLGCDTFGETLMLGQRLSLPCRITRIAHDEVRRIVEGVRVAVGTEDFVNSNRARR